MVWKVSLKNKLIKDLKNRRKFPKAIEKITMALIAELETSGPVVNWPNYGKLHGSMDRDRRHCHIQKGRPTWVACREVDSKNKMIEVYYVGTHEKAPY